MKFPLLFIVFTLTCFLSIPSTNLAKALLVSVSIPPQAFLVKAIGGKNVDVNTLVGVGFSPHDFEPRPRQTALVARSRAYLTIGMPFEKRLVEKLKSANGAIRFVDMAKEVPRRRMAVACSHEEHASGGCGHEEHASGGCSHEEHASGGCSHEEHASGGCGHDGHASKGCGQNHGVGAEDPHLWLSARNMMRMAPVVRDLLKELDGDNANEYTRNCSRVLKTLMELDEELKKSLAQYKGLKIYVFHPAFGYFADDYGLQQVPIEVEGKEPSARQLAQLIRRARKESVKVIFVQRQFARRAADKLASAIGGVVVALDPLAEDYLENLRAIAQSVKKDLQDRQ